MPLNSGSYATGELASLKYDKDATTAFKIEIDKDLLRLQFPPKITNDTKQSRWQEDHKCGYEEFAVWYGAYARKINIELNYVVWGSWDQKNISLEMRKLKGHLYKHGGEAFSKVPFVYISGWKIVENSKTGSNHMAAFRLMGINIEYSKEYVGTGNNQWPLHTKVNLECKLITQSGSTPGAPKYKEDHFDGNILPHQAVEQWY